MNDKFIKPEYRQWTNAVDYFNRLGKDAFNHIFINNRTYTLDLIAEIPTAKNVKDNSLYQLVDGYIKCSNGLVYSLFECLTIIKYNNIVKDAIYFVEFDLLKKEIPYIRVAGDYFKIIYTTNQYGFNERKLKAWKKETIIDDHGKLFLKEIPIYDDFIILPSNIDFKESENNSFNLYSKFHHKPI